MEVWDAYSKEFEIIEGMTLVRGEAIPDGVYHLVTDVIVRHADGSYLLMQRDVRKHFGGMWEATAGGSALKGEGPLACAIRELQEETGIKSEALTEVGRVVDDNNHSIYVEFLCVTDWPKGNILLQEGETSAYKWVTKDELVSMKKDELVTERIQKFISELKSLDISYVVGNSKFNYRVCGIMIHDDKVLAMRDERSPYYYLPGGRVQMGETAEQAVIREIQEELGVTPRMIRPLWLNQGFFTEDVDQLHYHELCVYFLLDAEGSEILEKGEKFTLQEKHHTHTFEWLAFDRLKDEYMYPIFLKTEMTNLPENFTLRMEFE
ncbi:MAG: NUDIX hydrolase [Clostridiales bacterium]|nr:NUDIX hydrolase [Clostridiales bacterium]